MDLVAVILFERMLDESVARLVTRLLYLEPSDPRWATVARLVEVEPPTVAADWRAKFRAFAGQLLALLEDERTPLSVSRPLEKAIGEINALEGAVASGDVLAAIVKRIKPEHGSDEKVDG
ncbi:MAG: hypothetical protein L0229_29710 [Blastocatellia bacterium]|nr:hypothetical protein [Blastocatellia bacterium]